MSRVSPRQLVALVDVADARNALPFETRNIGHSARVAGLPGDLKRQYEALSGSWLPLRLDQIWVTTSPLVWP
jgi:hypothetical protein